MPSRSKHTVLILLAVSFFAGCSGRAHVPIEFLDDAPCELASGVTWAGPNKQEHRARLSDWCRSVGQIIVRTTRVQPVDVAASGLIVVTWNQHEGYGDLELLLRSFLGKAAVVALVQEVARGGDSVPVDAPSTVRVPKRIGPRLQTNRDIVRIANDLNLSLAYLPSMPNGSGTKEDRGCAILSTLPLSDVVGIELPWVSQRRVAVMGTVTATKNGIPWSLRVVSLHLDNRLRRWQQASALAEFLDRHASSDVPTVIGGDFNAWFGTRDRTVSKIDHIVPLVEECGDHATLRFPGLRLDHLFTTLPAETRTGCFVGRNSFGSDHHPIILRLFRAVRLDLK